MSINQTTLASPPEDAPDNRSNELENIKIYYIADLKEINVAIYIIDFSVID